MTECECLSANRKVNSYFSLFLKKCRLKCLPPLNITFQTVIFAAPFGKILNNAHNFFQKSLQILKSAIQIDQIQGVVIH